MEHLGGDNSEYLWWMAVFAFDVWGFSAPVANVGVHLHWDVWHHAVGL